MKLVKCSPRETEVLRDISVLLHAEATKDWYKDGASSSIGLPGAAHCANPFQVVNDPDKALFNQSLTDLLNREQV
jgi:hypothetical protein